jgi:CRISPR-associated endoribonuclease Cas6
VFFQLEPLRFSFVAREPIYFPPGKSSNILRGAFGSIFRRIACLPHCPGVDACDHRAICPYARLFEPAGTGQGPSGLADWPRAFVFRAIHLDGQTFAPGQTFHFDLNLFDAQPPAITYFVLTFAQLARDGLGPDRSKVDLSTVSKLDENGGINAVVYKDSLIKTQDGLPPLTLDLTPTKELVSRLRVKFLTPTELKSGQQIAPRPEFAILATRVRDRISTLRELYGGGALPLDFRAFGEHAAMVKMIRCDIEAIDIQRRSTRTGQTHSIGGFIGEAEYEGDLGEFLPFLRAAHWTGVGRQTVWGKGQLVVSAYSFP